jgi:hypothetical protein
MTQAHHEPANYSRHLTMAGLISSSSRNSTLGPGGCSGLDLCFACDMSVVTRRPGNSRKKCDCKALQSSPNIILKGATVVLLSSGLL